jgi:hypothetical protein
MRGAGGGGLVRLPLLAIPLSLAALVMGDLTGMAETRTFWFSLARARQGPGLGERLCRW